VMHEKRREDMARKIASAARHKSFAGAVVLEIGADKHGVSTAMLAETGAARVISTNFRDDWPQDVNGAIERRRLDARRIADSFDADSIDIVFGVAILEHIDGLDAFFAGVRHALKSGGLLFAHGGPIWTSAKGHHVGFTGEAMEYRFGNAATNPIRDWTHLVFDKQSLADDMIARGTHAGDAAAIAAQIYEDPDRNRIGFRSLCESFDRSGLNLIERIDNAFAPPPPDLLAQIERGHWRGEERYDVSGVTFVARR
jgi:cyclopropane fatty-acyl-phospholipid synthase-like methyltransferase